MHRHRVALLFAVFAFALLIVPHTGFAATNTSFLGPIVPATVDPNNPNQTLQTCAAGWGAVLIVITNLIQFAIALGIIIAVLVLAYAGFLWVLNPTNPENRSTGRKLLINAAIGLVITLAAWLIINTVLIAIGYSGGIGAATNALFGGTSSNGIPTLCIQRQEVQVGPTITTQPSGVTTVPPSANAGTDKLNVQAAVGYLQSHYTGTVSNHRCLAAIQGALSAGGLTLSCANGYAGMCNGPLGSLGFQSLGSGDSSPQAGDIVVIQHVNGPNTIGHIAMFTGSTWVSDFVQSGSETPPGNPYPANEFGGAQYWRP